MRSTRLYRLISLTALTFSLVAYVVAQQTPPLAGIAHVALRVHDLAASIAFYQSLGFVQAFDLRRDNIPYESFIKINDRQFIELYPSPKRSRRPASCTSASKAMIFRRFMTITSRTD